MSKCVSCGYELTTGDVHWELGICNQCWNVYRHEKMPIPEYVNMLNKETYELQNEDLKRQLAAKDEEIKITKQLLEAYRQQCHESLKNEENTRKQVCDKIRQAFNKEDFWLYGDDYKIISVHEDKFNEILDQIEKGES